MVSVEAHRWRGQPADRREPVATNFKFFFPFAVTGAKDVPQALQYVEAYLKPFHSEREARQASVRLLAGGAEPAAPGPGLRSREPRRRRGRSRSA
jgi:hypothetical protein